MQFLRYAVVIFAASCLPGCSPSDSIDDDGRIFEGIAPEEAISLIGTEPFWNMEIAPHKSAGEFTARYGTMERPGDVTFPLNRFAGNNGLAFSGEWDGKSVQIAITPAECTDQMTGRDYPFAATLAIGDDVRLGCAYTDRQGFSGPQAP